jgi:hypothetical protein
MTDKELLLLAAKAAGIEHHGYCTDGFLFVGDGEKGAYDRWNPLANDGDALRLAVKLKLGVVVTSCDTEIYPSLTGAIKENHNDDPHAATRRAIVRAAAEIGKEEK